jgi:hypothetical protein
MKALGSVLAGLSAVILFSSLATAQPRSWNDQINTPGRFTILTEFGSAAAFDKETGLVWQRSPSASRLNWFDAHDHCIGLNIGNRKGWRLPSVQELYTLLNPSVPYPGPALPTGHPFTNVQSDYYWTSTTMALIPASAWLVYMGNGLGTTAQDTKTDPDWFAWCVRGGPGVDAQ